MRPEDAVLIDLYQKQSARAIAEMYGVSTSTVRYWVGQLRQAGKLEHKPRPSKRPDDETLRRLYATHTIEQMAAMYQVSAGTLMCWVREARQRGRVSIPAKQGGQRLRRPDSATLKELYRNHSAREIADMYGVKPDTVYHWVIALRDAGETVTVETRQYRSGSKK